MPKRGNSKFRSIIFSAFAAVAALLGAVQAALAGSIGGSFP